MDFDPAVRRHGDKVYGNEPPRKPMSFYLSGEAVCVECGYSGRVVINRDAVLYHECNKGNVSTEIPSLTLPVESIKPEKVVPRLPIRISRRGI